MSTSGDSYGGGRIRVDRGLHPKEAELNRAIYCVATDSVNLRAIGEEAGSLGFLEVAGKGENQYCRGEQVDGGGGRGGGGG